MYKDYYSDNVINYYAGFRTVELNQNITIIPKQIKYNTIERNLEGAKNKILITNNKEYSTILTAPKNNEPFIFTHIHVCTKNKPLSYEFLNAYNSSNLGFNGEIQANSKNHFKSIINTKLDTELKLFSDNEVEVFVKHVGISEKYQPDINEIEVTYNKNSHLLNWTQPINGQEFKYTVYIDKKGNMEKQGYTLCSLVDISKLGHYSEILITDSDNPQIILNFSKPELGDEYKDFDVIILAEQVNLGKITILSSVFDSDGKKSEEKEDESNHDNKSNTGLIVLICILSGIIVAGGIYAFIIYRKYAGKGKISGNNKETSMAMIKSAQKDKLVESKAEEPNQIDF